MGWLTKPESENGPEVVRVRTDSEWRRLLERSSADPVLLLKHSTACNISDCVYDEFREFLARRREDLARHQTAAGVVYVIEDRAVSDEVGRWAGVRHESPQVILFMKRRAVWHASHWNIDFDDLARRLSARIG